MPQPIGASIVYATIYTQHIPHTKPMHCLTKYKLVGIAMYIAFRFNATYNYGHMLSCNPIYWP